MTKLGDEEIPVGVGDNVNVTMTSPPTTNVGRLSKVFLYRRPSELSQSVYLGQTAIVGASPDTVEFDDDGGIGTPDPEVYVTEYLEEDHDAAPAARFVQPWEKRIILAGLEWDVGTERFTRPLALAISTLDRVWYFPGSYDADSPDDVGTELDGYAVTGKEITGIAVWQGQPFIFLDSEFFVLRGDSIRTGFYLARLDSVGCASQRLIADCVHRLVWLGSDGEFYSYRGGPAEPIGWPAVDGNLVDLTKAHDALYWDGRYIAYCDYDGAPSLLIYDVQLESWLVHHCPELAGICLDVSENKVYGITAQGYGIEVFAGAFDIGVDGEEVERAYAAQTQFMIATQPEVEAAFDRICLEAESGEDSPGVDVEVFAGALGRVNAESDVVAVAVHNESNAYGHNIDLRGHAVRVAALYTGEHPPTIHSLWLRGGEVP